METAIATREAAYETHARKAKNMEYRENETLMLWQASRTDLDAELANGKDSRRIAKSAIEARWCDERDNKAKTGFDG